MFTYNTHNMYLMGQIYGALADAGAPGTHDINAEIFPAKSLFIALIRTPKRLICPKLDFLISELMEEISPEDIDELIKNPKPSAMELRVAWFRGYDNRSLANVKPPLARLREKKGLTQNDLAELIGVPQNTIARWESGAVIPREKSVEKLAKVLGCKPMDII